MRALGRGQQAYGIVVVVFFIICVKPAPITTTIEADDVASSCSSAIVCESNLSAIVIVIVRIGRCRCPASASVHCFHTPAVFLARRKALGELRRRGCAVR